MHTFRIIGAILMATAVMGCDEVAPPDTQARPVRTIAVGPSAEGETISLTGQVRAKDQVSLAFRLDGRMIERTVRVGDVVSPGQVVARLDTRNQQNAVRSAEANLASAQAILTQARLTFQRQSHLSKGGWTTRARFDEAEQSLRTAEAQADSAQAQLHTAQDQLSYTVLSADGAGAITAVGAEPGEVVHAGQMVVQLARQGGRDAVFDVSEQIIRTGPRDARVEIVLTDDTTVRAAGRVREVAPQADSTTRTFQVKVEIIDPPEAMHLGSTVTGRIRLAPPPGVEVPASALTEANARPAVWVVDPRSQTVSLRGVDVARYDQAIAVISRGLETGELIVTAGVHALRPGQRVRLLGAAS